MSVREKVYHCWHKRHDRKGIPKELKTVNGREEISTPYVHHEDKKVMLVSYIDKKKSGKKNVIVLTTMHDKVKITKDRRQQPHVHVMYDHTKGGVDIVDLLSTNHSTRIKSRRWPLNALAFVLDTCRTNAKTILTDNNVRLTNFELTYQLGKSLVLPNIHRRYDNPNGLQISIINRIRRVLNIKEVNHLPQIENAIINCGH